MVNKRKKIISLLVAAIIAITPVSLIHASSESSDIKYVIKETRETTTITKGLTLEKVTRFTLNGWYSINILRADLTEPYIRVDALTNTQSPGKLTTVKALAEQANAVAAVNASFFSYGINGTGYSIGPTVKSGELISSTNDFNRYGDTMASFSLDKLNKAFFDYWKTHISITSPSGVNIPITNYNKTNAASFTDLSMFDNKWGKMSIGAYEKYPDLVEMLVVDDKVAQILIAQPAVEIPENGYVIVTRGANGKLLIDNFKIGDPVVLNLSTTPDWKNYSMSLTGSSILIKDGKIPEKFSYSPQDITKASPKTAIGITADGRQLIAMTVDGRQASSVGFTLQEMASYMKYLGAYNAINMDGGGSTTMVARKPGETSIEVVNSPSDGRLRGVASGLGIFTTAPASELSGLILEAEDYNVFVNTSREIKVKGYDKYHNPVEVDPSAVEWSVSGVKGSFKGNVFYPTTYGECTITASIGEITGSVNMSVLSPPVRLSLSTNTLKIPVGKTKEITVTGYNKNGFAAIISPSDVTWAVNGNIGKFENSVFKATARGTGYIDASVGNVHAYCAVSVSSDVISVRDNFEAMNGTFLSYPATVTGSYTISTEQFRSGKASGKLTYDFTVVNGTRAAYLILPDKGMLIESGSSKIGLWAYNDHENPCWLRMEITDSKGKKHLVDLSRNLNWTGWKYLEISLGDISLPARLNRIYIVLVDQVPDKGTVYFDDLQVTDSSYPAIDYTKIPEDTVPVDEANKYVVFTKATDTSFRFGVFGQSHEPVNDVQKHIVKRFADKINAYVDVAAIVGKGNHLNVTSLINKPVIATITEDIKETQKLDYKYSYMDYKNSRFFRMDMRNGGLRVSDKAQWQNFMSDLESFKGKHVFIFMENDPATFTDKLELNLFKETLTEYKKKTGKTVYVFYKGNKNAAVTERGVKYISTAGFDVDGLTMENTDPAKFCLVTIKGDTVTYNFSPVITKPAK